ncbi:SMI1/KNR4 family protein [Stenotrophomonas sp. 24(2023)]|uniref:SMI1/KNR4 family protein n=1 Tax=Stenotrophomonas sp. 24(2023) TaxID=3068324 RepID=UPI0027E02870|nr:SMI1/KNR4 family protein [Stenotrophomonas sp. 24(2023)]WMJ69056.1 SMI1/KNR4 family protein [Stenotrophomonas sp. 24(2023)]
MCPDQGSCFERLDEVIAGSSRVRVFPGRVVPPDLVKDAERLLGLPLPVSYKVWLAEYGNLFIGPDAVFGLAEPENRDVADDDLVYNARLVEENGFPPSGMIPVYVPDADEAFYFDTRGGLKDGEYPVLRYDYNTGEFESFAVSFLQFLMEVVRRAG